MNSGSRHALLAPARSWKISRPSTAAHSSSKCFEQCAGTPASPFLSQTNASSGIAAPMKILTIIIRSLLGLVFVVFGAKGFLRFLPMPPLPHGLVGEFLHAFFASGY